jgi:lipoate-protein ligase A
VRARPWRLILDTAAAPAWNMAVDEVLLARYTGEGLEPPTLRLYGWSKAALSLGRTQTPLRGTDVPVVRRPTGGHAVLHDDERTYAVAGGLRRDPFPGGVLDTYRRIAAALVAGLRRLGLEVEPAAPGGRREEPSASSCFDQLGTHEIAWQGRKLVGSAQVRRHRGFLQHGSLPRRLLPERLGAVLREPVRPERFVDLARALGRTPSDQEIDRALIAGFEEAFGCAFEEDALAEGERRAAELLARTKYGA